MRIKGRYVAQIIIDININPEDEFMDKPSFDEIQKGIISEFTPQLKKLIEDEALTPECKVDVIQQYADVWEAEEEQEE